MSTFSKVIFFSGGCSYRKESAIRDVDHAYGGPVTNQQALIQRLKAAKTLDRAKGAFSTDEVSEAIKKWEVYYHQLNGMDDESRMKLTGKVTAGVGELINKSLAEGMIEKDMLLKRWNWRTYLDLLYARFGDLLDSSDWKFVVSNKEPPVFSHGKRNFIVSSSDPRSASKDKLATVDGFLCGHTVKREKIELLLKGVMDEKTIAKQRRFEMPEGYDGAKQSRANEDSPTIKTQLRDFVTKLTSHSPGIGFPVCSVSDCNTFHNSGYLWGLYAVKMAFKEFEEKGAVAVLNFDQHDDNGSSKNNWVLSSAWGLPLLSEPDLKEYGGCYVVIGMPPAKNETSAHEAFCRKAGTDDCSKFGPGKKEDTGALPSTADCADTKFWESMIQGIGKPIEYVFITVDRDCLPNHYTTWQDMKPSKYANAKALTVAAGRVLKALRTASLKDYPVYRGKGQTIDFFGALAHVIGFDITGLPDSVLSSTQARPWLSEEKVWGYAKSDVKDCFEYIKSELEETVEWVDFLKT